jgi:S1-C subfamily serine protease
MKGMANRGGRVMQRAAAGGRMSPARVNGVVLRTALAVLILSVASAAPAVAQEQALCPDARLSGGTLGVGLYQCAGGACSLYRTSGDGYAHSFSVEPRVWDLSSPARGKLKDGDVLVAIDGSLITTRSGGRKLATVRPGQSVSLRVRRGGDERTVRVTAVEGCSKSRLTQTTKIPPN